MPVLTLRIGDCMAINPSADTEPGLDLRLSCGYCSELSLGAHRCGSVAGPVLRQRVCSGWFAAGIISVKCPGQKSCSRSCHYGRRRPKYQTVLEDKSALLLSEL